MSVAKVIELSAASPTSFEKAIEAGIAKATETVRNVRGAWIKEMKVVIDNGKVTEYRVDLKVSFVME
ncbi:MAG: dodecin family protein [Phycisphaerales bacterium JB039]